MADSDRGHLLVNLLTGSRLVFAVVVAVLVPWAAEEPWAILVATALVGAVELSDLLDGHLARRHNVVSEFGKVFDPYADSVSRLTVYWALAMMGRSLYIVPLVMAVRDISVSYVRIVMMKRGWDGSARFAGKLKALVQGLAGLALMSGPLWWGGAGRAIIIGLSLAVIAVCVYSGADYGSLLVRTPEHK